MRHRRRLKKRRKGKGEDLSAEAARIISKISGRKSTAGTGVLLGTVKAASPLTVKFDEVGFDISTGLLVNSLLLGHQRTGNISSPAMSLPNSKINFDGGLAVGDRVAGVAAGGSQYIILCKVVTA